MLEHLHTRLAGTVIECLPWHEFIRRYDGPGTVFYLDPPYWGCENDYGKAMFEPADFSRMADQLAQLQGSFLLSLNDRPEVRRIMARFTIATVQTSYTIRARNDGQGARYELLISGPTRS